MTGFAIPSIPGRSDRDKRPILASALLYGQPGMKTTSEENNVVSLAAVRELRRAQVEDYEYKARILAMSKVELLDEMVRFQEQRALSGHLTPTMMIQGQILFRALEQQAETETLKSLSRSYRRHLSYELQDYLKNNGTAGSN